jgi:hypothetical protein
MPGLVKNSMKIVPGYEENALVNWLTSVH